MKSPDPSWDDLRVVVLATRAGSLSGVARHLDVSVATVGRRLDRIEEALGVRLFHRHAGGLTPTEEAALLLERADAVADEVAAFVRAAKATEREEGVVTISTLETVVTHVIAPRLAEFRAAHPRVDLVLRSSPRIVRLDRRMADIAIRVVRPHESRVVGRKIGTLDFGLYASPAYIARRGRPSPGDLHDHDVVMYDASWDSIPEMTWLAERMRGANAAFRVTTANAIFETLASGAAVGLLPCFLATPELERLAGPEELPSRDLWLVIHEDLRRVPHVRAAAEFLARATAEALERG